VRFRTRPPRASAQCSMASASSSTRCSSQARPVLVLLPLRELELEPRWPSSRRTPRCSTPCRRAGALAPDDPQRHLVRPAVEHEQHRPDRGTVDADIDAVEAGPRTAARSTCAIVDGGGQTHHTDLLANRWRSGRGQRTSGVDDDANGYVDDKYGWNAYNNNGSIPATRTHARGGIAARAATTRPVWPASTGRQADVRGGLDQHDLHGDQAYSYVLSSATCGCRPRAKGANVSRQLELRIDYANCASTTYKPWTTCTS